MSFRIKKWLSRTYLHYQVTDPRYLSQNTETMADADAYGVGDALRAPENGCVPADHVYTDIWVSGGLQPTARAVVASPCPDATWMHRAIRAFPASRVAFF